MTEVSIFMVKLEGTSICLLMWGSARPCVIHRVIKHLKETPWKERAWAWLWFGCFHPLSLGPAAVKPWQGSTPRQGYLGMGKCSGNAECSLSRTLVQSPLTHRLITKSIQSCSESADSSHLQKPHRWMPPWGPSLQPVSFWSTVGIQTTGSCASHSTKCI